MDPGEPHWRTNSSFSPPPSRVWDCRFQSDGLPHGSHGALLHGSSLSSDIKGSRSRVRSDQYTNHQHSVSDGVLFYSGSPPDSFQAPRWMPTSQKLTFGEFATPSVRGSRLETSLFPHSTERQFTVGASAASNSFGSPSSLPESGQWESTSKQSISFTHCNFSGRRPFMSKPVYPLVFRNPVSDGDAFGYADTRSISRLMPDEDKPSPSHWPDNSSSIEHKFHKTLTELQNMETSPDPSSSSRREGFRWSNASSYDLGLDGENFDVAEHLDVENLRSPKCSMGDQKCGLCGRLLWQKSPWSAYRIGRGGDMPIAGVLPCSHIFHVECLEQTTPKMEIHDPPCPVCMKTIGVAEDSPTFSEPLQMALRSVRRNCGVVISDVQGNNSNDEASDDIQGGLRRNWSLPVSQLNRGSSLIKNHLKKHFTFKAKTGKSFFSTKVFHRTGLSSSRQDTVGCSRSVRP